MAFGASDEIIAGMDYQQIRDKIEDGKQIVEQYKDETPKPVLEVCYSMFDINSLLVDKLEELDNKISKNSRNSSRPPSSDDKNRPKPNQSLRKKSGKKPGGQKGHKGSGLKRVDNPDEVVSHKPSGFCDCGQDLGLLDVRLASSRQVFEVELLKRVVEHQVFKGSCTCGKNHCGLYPQGVNSPTQYGESVRGVVAYLNKYQLLPYDRIEELMGDLFGVSLSEGSIDNFSKYAESSLGDFKKKFFNDLKKIKYGNVDETPTRTNGKRGYLHVFSNLGLSFLYYHKSRGMKAVDECGLLSRFKGTLVHDCYSMYFNYGKSHAICNAHLLRELTFIEEKYKYQWAHRVKTYLYDLNGLVKLDKRSAETILDTLAKEKLQKNFEELLLAGRAECTHLIKDRGKKQHPAINLLNRILRLKKEILHFMYDYDIPFTNNQAERDLRMAKVHLKITGGFRSERGAQNYALFRSYISTVKKHGLSVFEAIKNLYSPQGNRTLDLIFRPSLAPT